MNVKDLIEKPEINFWIGIIVPLIGVAISWGVISTKVKSLETRFDYFGGRFIERQEKVDGRLDSQDKVFLDIQIKLAEIQKDILYIKENIN
jgi:hypothetical protein